MKGFNTIHQLYTNLLRIFFRWRTYYSFWNPNYKSKIVFQVSSVSGLHEEGKTLKKGEKKKSGKKEENKRMKERKNERMNEWKKERKKEWKKG